MTNLEKLKTKKIVECISQFDFDRVAKVMKFLNWKWAIHDGILEVPDKYDIVEAATNLLYEVFDELLICSEEDFSIGTGGLVAKAYKYKDEDDDSDQIGLTLMFVLTKSETL